MLSLKLTKSNSTISPIRKVKDQTLQRISINGTEIIRNLGQSYILLIYEVLMMVNILCLEAIVMEIIASVASLYRSIMHLFNKCT